MITSFVSQLRHANTLRKRDLKDSGRTSMRKWKKETAIMMKAVQKRQNRHRVTTAMRQRWRKAEMEEDK